jgi:hypothetical protein
VFFQSASTAPPMTCAWFLAPLTSELPKLDNRWSLPKEQDVGKPSATWTQHHV